MSTQLVVVIVAVAILVALAVSGGLLALRAARERALRRRREQRRRELQTALANLARAALPERLEGVARGIEQLREEGLASTVRSSVAALASGALSDTTKVRRAASPEGAVTLMFSDIEGSTGLNTRLGDARWLEVLERHNRIVRAQLRRHRGNEVKAVGDGFMLAFAHPDHGVACAVEIQRGIAAERWDLGMEGTDGGGVRVRMGLHCGQVVRRGHDLLGLNVAVAARIAQQAGGGEILVSAAIVESVDANRGVTFGRPRRVPLKGIPDPQLVYPVQWTC